VALSIVAAVGLTAFVVREMRTTEPLVDFHLLKYGTFSAGVFVGSVLGFVLFGSMVLLPLFMQQLLGFPAMTAGLWSSPRGIGTLIMLPITGILLGRRFEPRILLTAGLVLASFAFFGYGDLDLQAGGTDFLWPQIIQGAGLAMVFTPLSTIAMDPIPLQSMSYATSLFSLARNIGSSMGVSFVTTQLARRTQFHQSRLVESITVYNPWVRDTMRSMQNMMGNTADATTRAAGMLYGQVYRQAAAMSYLEMFHLLGYLFLAVTPLVWVMRSPQHLKEKKRPA
jgi:DHA2 family multidrug resistance protein